MSYGFYYVFYSAYNNSSICDGAGCID